MQASTILQALLRYGSEASRARTMAGDEQHRVVHGSIFITHDPTQPTDIQIQPNPLPGERMDP